jgi:SAM-dependent methyltransferase
MAERVSTHDTGAEAQYWSDFYEHHDFNAGSSFFEFINQVAGLPDTVIDIGCGDGRDSLAFGLAGKRVYGLDRSDIGVEAAMDKSKVARLDHAVAFAVCDVSDGQALSSAFASIREAADDGNVCYYMRFFLHSIPEDTQATLLAAIAKNAKPGDVFAAEFRTDKDIDHSRVFGDTHYRRYQSAAEFSAQLQNQYGWIVTYETESRGLSPFGDEDPTLYRGVAARPSTSQGVA